MTSPVEPTRVALVQNAEVGSVSGLALQGDPELGPDLATVQRATAVFHQVEHATGARYLDPNGGHCDQSPAGAMGIHSANPALIQSQTLEPEHPEVRCTSRALSPAASPVSSRNRERRGEV